MSCLLYTLQKTITKQTNNVIHILFTLNKQSPTKYQHHEHSLHCKSTAANHHKVCMNTQYKHSKTKHHTIHSVHHTKTVNIL